MTPTELAQAGTFDLLQALIISNNLEADELAQDSRQLSEARQQISALQELINDQQLTIAQQNDELQLKIDEIADQAAELKECHSILLTADKLAKVSLVKDQELSIAKKKITELQQEITAMGNVKKLNRLVKSQKAKAVERNKRIETLEKQTKEYRKELKDEKRRMLNAVEEVIRLKQQLAHNTGAGIYHNGEHHLIIWPEKTKMQRSDGSLFEARTLLYMHQSGCARMATLDPESGEASFCASPRGGLRPSKEVREFAKNWLYTVNVLQEGVVKDSDMVAVNYNAELEPV